MHPLVSRRLRDEQLPTPLTGIHERPPPATQREMQPPSANDGGAARQSWRRIDAVLQRALMLAPGEREAFVRRECGHDTGLGDEVLALVHAVEESETFLEQPAFRAVYAEQELEPRVIGPYSIEGPIASGGSGVVYRAMQRNPPRPVALKLLRGGALLGERHVARFRREAATLGLLNHPAIASIYEAGTTRDGLHFLAMELVDGEPLHDWVRWKQPSLEEKLQLFRGLCEAVVYAHEQGVIHRDLKPGNIMVVDTPAPAKVKVLDFGLARLTGNDPALGTTHVTEAGRVLGTLAYMSPEQARGESDQVDECSDTYALGVILYELVTGRLPYDASEGHPHEILRRIADAVPQRPSSIDKRWGGDLEIVILKALEKERSRRYASVAELREDLVRLRDGRPILARRPSRAYQLASLVKRHRGPFAMASTVFALLLASTIGFSVLWRRAVDSEQGALEALDEARVARNVARQNEQAARDAEQVAIQAAERAKEQHEDAFFVNYVMRRALAAAGPYASRGRDMTVTDLFEQVARIVGDELAERPVGAAAVCETLGLIYDEMGRYDQGERFLGLALDLRRQRLPPDSYEVLDSLRNMGRHLHTAGAIERAEATFREALELWADKARTDRPLIPEERFMRAMTQGDLALALQSRGRLDEAMALYAEAIPAVRETRTLIAPSHDLVSTERRLAQLLSSYAGLLLAYERYGESRAHYEESREIYRATGAVQDSPLLAIVETNLATVHHLEGHPERAIPHYLDALQILRRAFRGDAPETATLVNNLGVAFYKAGVTTTAEQAFREALTLRSRLLPAGHPETNDALFNLGSLLTETGRHAEAEPLLREALTGRTRVVGPRHAAVGRVLGHLGDVERALGDLPCAEQHLERALVIFEAAPSGAHEHTAWVLTLLAEVDLEGGRPLEAETRVRRSLELGPAPAVADRARALLDRCLLRRGALAEAEATR